MKFKATHRIVFTSVNGSREFWNVMLMPDNDGYRSAAYTRAEYDCVAPSDWERDKQGRWWFQGKATPGNGTVTVELIS